MINLDSDLLPFSMCFKPAITHIGQPSLSLLRVQNDLLRAIDNGSEALLILLDFSAAFDTIDHDICLHRLQNRFGISGIALSWIASFFKDRTQFIDIDGTTSLPEVLHCGVPQGSVLGPILFCLYVAPLEDIFIAHGIEAMIYADDTQLYTIIKKSDGNKALPLLEKCLTDIKTWSAANKLILNDRKTEVLHIHSKFSRSVSDIPYVTIGGLDISPITEVRNLGVLFDQNLSFKQQINSSCKSSYFALSNINKIRKYLDYSTTEKLMHAFVISRLDQSNSLLYGLPRNELQKLQRVQNTAARVVAKPKKDEHITETLKKLHWLPVEARIRYKILLLVYKALNGLAPSYIQDLLQKYTTSRCLRSTGKQQLAIPKSSTKSYGDRAFSIAGPNLWNNLPLELRCAESVNIFKSKLKTYLFTLSYNV